MRLAEGLNGQQQTFGEQPQNTSVLAGNEVKLKCSVKNQKGEAIWCKDEGFCTFGRNKTFIESRYSIEGDANNGKKSVVSLSLTLGLAARALDR